MATKQFPHKNVFSAGEVSERFEGRTDVGKYYSALKRLINFLPFTQGGVTRRPGTRFGLNSFCDVDEGRIIPFKFTRDVDSNFLVHLCDESLSITDDNGTEIPVGPGPLLVLCEEVIDNNIFVDPATLILPDQCARFQCSTSAKLNFRASGGVPPYSWSVVQTGLPPILIVTGLNDRDVEINAPINLNPQVGLPAYLHSVCTQTQPASACRYDNLRSIFDCADIFINSTLCSVTTIGCPNCCFQITAICDGINDDGPCNDICPPFGIGTPHINFETLEAQGDCPIAGQCQPTFPAKCGDVVDQRSPGTIASGCAPCTVAIGEAVLTVTDNIGTMISIVLKADP